MYNSVQIIRVHHTRVNFPSHWIYHWGLSGISQLSINQVAILQGN